MKAARSNTMTFSAFFMGRAVADTDSAEDTATDTDTTVDQDSMLLALPSEILLQVLTYLDCPPLVALSRTCRLLHAAANDDLQWARIVESVLETDFPDTPYPSTSYRNLYISHHPYWFVPKAKLWISNDPHIGKVMLCRYDPRRGCIEGYRLLAERGPSQSLQWPYNRNVVIHTFQPKVHLWLDDPLLKLEHDSGPSTTKQGWWEGEMKMSMGRPGHNTSGSFFLTRNVPDDPRMDVWPPRTIPGMPRVRAASG